MDFLKFVIFAAMNHIKLNHNYNLSINSFQKQ